MNARLDDRLAEPDLVVTVLLVVAAALYLAFAGWLIAVEVSAGGARHVPTVTIDNRTELTSRSSSTLDRATLARQGWTVHIPATATTDLERAGYQ